MSQKMCDYFFHKKIHNKNDKQKSYESVGLYSRKKEVLFFPTEHLPCIV